MTQRIRLLCMLVLVMGCGSHEKAPRRTASLVSGYPYRFGMSIKVLLGRDEWSADSLACAGHVTYRLHVPSEPSRWFGNDAVTIVADTTGALEAFAATRNFASQDAAQQSIQDLLPEIRRRYGAPTDSVAAKKTILSASWEDTSGNFVAIGDSTMRLVISSASGRIRKACPGIMDVLPKVPRTASGG